MFKLEEVDIENIFFVEPKKKSTGYHSYFFYDNEPLIVKSSEYFVNKITSKEIVLTNNNNYFSHFLKQLEKFAKREIMCNSEKWFNGKKFEEDTLNKLFISNFNDNKLSLSTTRNSIYFDKNNNKVSYTDIKKNDKIICIVYIKGLWFEKSQYGFLTEVVQSKFYSKPRPRISYPSECLISDKIRNTILSESEDEQETPLHENRENKKESPLEQNKENRENEKESRLEQNRENRENKEESPLEQNKENRENKEEKQTQLEEVPNVPDSDLDENTEEINCEENGEVIFF